MMLWKSKDIFLNNGRRISESNCPVGCYFFFYGEKTAGTPSTHPPTHRVFCLGSGVLPCPPPVASSICFQSPLRLFQRRISLLDLREKRKTRSLGLVLGRKCRKTPMIARSVVNRHFFTFTSCYTTIKGRWVT